MLCCVLCSCATITYSVQIAAGGARTLTLRVYYDDDMTEEDRAYIKAFLTEVSDSRKAGGRTLELVEGEGYVALKEEFESATEYMIAMGYTGDELNEDPTPKVNLNAYFFEYVSEMTLATRATILSYAFRYAIGDYSARGGDLLERWRAYCDGSSAIYSSGMYEVFSALARTETSSLYDATVAAMSGDKGDRLAETLQTWLADKGYDLRDVDFRYTYEHVYKSVYPRECTKSYTNSETGNTVYEWDMSVADIPETTITLCQKAPNAWAWELTAIAVGVLAIGIMLVVIVIKRRKVDNASRETE